jgi:hypothetical protein
MQQTVTRQRKNGDERGWFVLLLTGLFAGLRLGGVTGWQWYWVCAPQWANLMLAVLLGEDEGDAFPLLLTGLFLGLRLGGVTHWSWWWVFAPLWWPIAMALAGLVVYLGAALVTR